METIEQVNEDFNVKKPKRKGLIISLIIIAVIIIALLLVYFLIFAKPEFIFNSAIDKLFAIEEETYDSIKVNSKVKVSMEAKDTSIQEQLSELEKYTFNLNTQLDIKEKDAALGLGVEYDNDEVVNANIYYNNEELYAYLNGLFDKYIQIDMPQEAKDSLKTAFESFDISDEQKEKNKKAIEIIRDELKNQIKEEGTFEKEKVTIDLNDKETKVNKSMLVLTEKALLNVLENMCGNLADNDEFIDCFEESPKDALSQISDELKNTDTESEYKITISIYTKGLLNKFVGAEVEIDIPEEDQKVTVTMLQEDEEVYSFNVEMKTTSGKVDLIKGTIETQTETDNKDEQKGKTTLTMEIAEVGTAKIELDYSSEFNKGIDGVDLNNVVNMNDLTEQDMQGIMEKLMERPLIGEIIESQMNSTTNNNTPVQQQNTPTLTTSQNQVSNYGFTVTYSVPAGCEYDSDFSSDYRKYYDMDNQNSDISAIIGISWYTDDDYIQYIERDYNYYTTDSTFYKNVNLSELKTINVGGNEFKYQIISYESNSEYYSERYQSAYIWYRLNDEYIFTVELEATDADITEELITSFLNIQVGKVSE